MSAEQSNYDDGGWIQPGATPMAFTLADDECVIAPRDGQLVCIRDHEPSARGHYCEPIADPASYTAQAHGGPS
ncbi:hypothetical protein KXR83_05705 [Williamsia muralis]|uniref:hypothetical protein n=1 Tax=Williamsia marianensis TaxID=85044 RepID=UPI003F16ED83